MGKFDLFGARLENALAVGAQAQIDQEADAAADRAKLEEAAYKKLLQSMATALQCSEDGAIVASPAFGHASMPARQAVLELSQYPEGEFIEPELFKLAALAMRSTDLALRMAAMAWGAKVADAHARLHAVDAADADVVHEVLA